MKILTDSTTGKAFLTAQDKALVLPNSINTNARFFTHTVSAAGDNVKLVDADPDVAAHYNDNSVNVIVFPITSIDAYSTTTSFSLFYGSNATTAQSFHQHWKRLGEHTSYRESALDLNSSTGTNNFFRVTSDGSIYAFPHGGGNLEAATYMIIFIW